MIVRFFEKFDDHCILYFFLIGLGLAIFGKNPNHDDPLAMGLLTAAGGGMVWYSIKALLITGNTIATWKQTHPGEPMFHAGGLTEYDSELARRIGEASEAARRRNLIGNRRAPGFMLKLSKRHRHATGNQ